MVKVFGLDGSVKSEIDLPKVFSIEPRSDLIRRAVLALQSARRQAYGADIKAGLRTSARYHGVKDVRDSMKNKEIARGPRIVGSSPGQNMRMRRSPQTRGGRRAHPPRIWKVYKLKMNKKEMELAMVSAVSSTAKMDLLKCRGHKYDGELPIIVEDKIEGLSKTKDVLNLIYALKLDGDLRRIKRRVRAGKGKMRGRRYKTGKSVLFIVSKSNGVGKAAANIPGVDIASVKDLNVELLAPGTYGGRLTVWSESAVKEIGSLYG